MTRINRVLISALILGTVIAGSITNPASAYVAKVRNTATLCSSITMDLRSQRDGGGRSTLVPEGSSTNYKDFNSFWVPKGHYAQINYSSWNGRRVFTPVGPTFYSFDKATGLTRTFDVRFINLTGACA